MAPPDHRTENVLPPKREVFEPVAVAPAAPPPHSGNGQELLGFSTAPGSRCIFLEGSGEAVTVSIAAQLGGIFFVAESPWNGAGAARARSPELTCYRRNLFKITGTVFVPRGIKTVVTDDGERRAIVSLMAELTASESLEGKPAKVVSMPTKTAVTAAPTTATGYEPIPLDLDIDRNFNRHSDPCPFPISWERLQFRTATAKNNRRASAQQHYKLTLNVVAALNDGSKASLCQSSSVSIIVRGRSPRSFLPHKDGAPVKHPKASPRQADALAAEANARDKGQRPPRPSALPRQSSHMGTEDPRRSIAHSDSYPLDLSTWQDHGTFNSPTRRFGRESRSAYDGPFPTVGEPTSSSSLPVTLSPPPLSWGQTTTPLAFQPGTPMPRNEPERGHASVLAGQITLSSADGLDATSPDHELSYEVGRPFAGTSGQANHGDSTFRSASTIGRCPSSRFT